MQQSPRFAPFGPWKSSSTSANHFPRFLSGLLAFPERHFPEAHSPYGPWAIPPLLTEDPLGKHVTSFPNVMKPNASTDASLHLKWRECWYRPLNKVAPQIGLGGILQNLNGHHPNWSAKPLPSGPNTPPLKKGESPRFPRSDYEELSPERLEAFKASGSRLARILYSSPNDAKTMVVPTPPIAQGNPVAPSVILKNDKPTDDELKMTIGGPTGYLSWDHIAQTSDVYSFFQKRRKVANSLYVDWQDSAVDPSGSRGRTTLKLLFRYLSKPFTCEGRDAEHGLSPLASLTSLAVKVPHCVKDLASIDLFGQITEEDDSIDLTEAVNLQVFGWQGDFGVFALKFSNLRFASLSSLSLTECLISIDSAIALVHNCRALEDLILETIVPSSDIIFPEPGKFALTTAGRADFPNLSSLKIRCAAHHGLFMGRMDLKNLKSFVLHIEGDGIPSVEDFNYPTFPWSELEHLGILGKSISHELYNYLQARCESPIHCEVEM